MGIRRRFYKIGLILGVVIAFINMLFNKEGSGWLEMAAPIVIYISFFAIRVIRLPQVLLEFIMILSVVLSFYYFPKYSIEIGLLFLIYFIVILILHRLRILPYIYED